MASLSISTLCRYMTLFVDKFIQTLPQSPPYHLLSQWHSLKSLLKSVPIPLESLHNQLSDMIGCERKASLDFLEKIMNPIPNTTPPYINFDAYDEKLKEELKGIKEESPRQTVGKSINKISPMSNQASMKNKPNLFNDVTETTEILLNGELKEESPRLTMGKNNKKESPQFQPKKRPANIMVDLEILSKPVPNKGNYRSNTMTTFQTPQHQLHKTPLNPFLALQNKHKRTENYKRSDDLSELLYKQEEDPKRKFTDYGESPMMGKSNNQEFRTAQPKSYWALKVFYARNDKISVKSPTPRTRNSWKKQKT